MQRNIAKLRSKEKKVVKTEEIYGQAVCDKKVKEDE